VIPTLEERIRALRALFVELRKTRDVGVTFETGERLGKEPPWDALQALGDRGKVWLESITNELDTRPPQSLVKVICNFGYVSVFEAFLPKLQTPLILTWAQDKLGDPWSDILSLNPKNLVHGPNQNKLHGMAFVNDPGDAPGHFYAYIEELPSDPGEYIWCYIGFDTAYPDGVRLAPIATDFTALIFTVALGLTDVLLLPKKKAASQQRALQKIAGKRSELYRTALGDIERSLELTAGAQIHLAMNAENGPTGSWTLERGREAIRERLSALSL
jgi:hypothetical protein